MTTKRDLIAQIIVLRDQARKALALALEGARFDDLSDLTPIAKDLAALADRWTQAAPDVAPSSELAVLNRKKSEGYPQFVREKDELVKVGWSARDAAPYEHRVPKTVIDLVVEVVVAQGKIHRRFSMDDVFGAIKQKQSKTHAPSYQVYAAVSWLKWQGMVLQHGRQGYSVVRMQTLTSSVRTAWEALPRR